MPSQTSFPLKKNPKAWSGTRILDLNRSGVSGDATNQPQGMIMPKHLLGNCAIIPGGEAFGGCDGDVEEHPMMYRELRSGNYIARIVVFFILES